MQVPTTTRVIRRAGLIARLAETWVHRPPSPPRAVVDVTRRCNLRCAMCRTWEAPGADELTPTEIGRLVAAMPRLCWLDLTGGEPLLRRDFGEILDAVLDGAPALHVLHFQTNGWFLRRAVAAARRVVARRPEVDLIVTVSIDGPEAVHDGIRGRAGAYRRAIATATALGDVRGVEVHVGTTIVPGNADRIAALERSLRRDLPDFDPRRWHLNVAHTSAHFFGNGHLGDALRTDAAPILRTHLRRRGVPRDLVGLMESVYLLHLAAVQAGEPSSIPCQALRSTVFVSPEGDVYPCHLWDRPLGNVRRAPFDAIWRSATTARAREGVRRLECGGCFSACEAYPALAGAPLHTAWQTMRRALAPARRRATPQRSPAGTRRLPVVQE